MSCHQWSYNSLKELFAQKNISARELEELKECFADEIGSTRRLSSARTFSDLLDILERRDEFNENNIQTLKEIGDYLQDEDIITGTSQYTFQSHDKLTNYDKIENEYACRRLEEDIEEEIRISRLRNPQLQSNVPKENSDRTSKNPVVLYPFIGKKREAVYKLISTEISKRWRDLGREIGIDYQLENLEADYPRNVVLRVRKMLELFEKEEKVDSSMIVSYLCDALENCRRLDLSERVQEIMTS